MLEAKAKDQGHNFASGLQKKLKIKVIELKTEVKVKFSFVIFLFHKSKNSAVLEPRTRHFREIVVFEAKAKDLSFEAKDFKMCPQGLHL